MPTASSYITTTGQGGSGATWTNLSNADGAPDAAVASCDTQSGAVNSIQFTHSVSIPAGSTVDQVRFVMRWADLADFGGTVEIEFWLHGVRAFVFEVAPPQVSLADRAYTPGVSPAVANINAGTGELRFPSGAPNDLVLAIDSIQIQVDYTEVTATRDKLHSRPCSRPSARSAAKAPTEY